ncbi:uncharacterized protein LDX57_012912 [Aspergillus melleus]|uniref:uncharacterized protein n=1 Tax=Aspergillus melleus TaxID=138277 RepID=UPI001E8D1252|nr:uncharacterized protein LDX57_012912 [Aspergillus melleus]KAH8435281.1 hypothetical protein LDX57_012912 [Aspergillus melleus]
MSGNHTHPLSFDPGTLKFCRLLQRSESSSLYEITLSDNRYCLKVFHNNGDPGYAPNGRDMNRFRRELTAYKNLHSWGVCQKGVVPAYHGYIEQLDPALYRPHLDHFAGDQNQPNAIMLEYLPDPEELNCVNYSAERFQVAMQGLSEIHRARVLHNDPYPKNIVLVHGEASRVVWIDFDVSTTYTEAQMEDHQVKQYFEEEFLWARSFGDLLKRDQEEGQLPNLSYY